MFVVPFANVASADGTTQAPSSYAYLPSWNGAITGDLEQVGENYLGHTFSKHDFDEENNMYFVSSEDYGSWMNSQYSANGRGFHLLKITPDGSVEYTEKVSCTNYCNSPDYAYSKVVGVHAVAEDQLFVTFSVYNTQLSFGSNSQFFSGELRGANPGKTNNLDIVQETLTLRQERATLLGHNTFSEFKLETEMARKPEKVTELLMAVWEPAKLMANRDAKILTEMMQADGFHEKFLPSDWRYYSEKRRASEHDLNETELKPYFQLDQMIKASFHCAKKLFNLDFHQIDAPMYHPDVRVWEVTRENKHIAIFIGDYFARPSKRSGAWCSRFRGQSSMDKIQRPITVNVCNFAKAPKGQKCLLNFDDARTLFHEFGHALHSMLSDVKYAYISGTSVARDFVELPSQLYEHWLSVPSVLEKFAIHAETNKAIPKDLLEKLLKAENYDQGFSTVEYVSSALVDLAFHNETLTKDPMQKQKEVLDRIKMPAEITMRHATPHFAHIFSGDGYSSGYYSYMWSEVMDADAFEAFNEINDPFSLDIAHSLEKNIYSAGGSLPADELYMNFRGSMPKVEALLKGRGLLNI